MGAAGRDASLTRRAGAAAGAGPELRRFRAQRRQDLVDHAPSQDHRQRRVGDALAGHALRHRASRRRRRRSRAGEPGMRRTGRPAAPGCAAQPGHAAARPVDARAARFRASAAGAADGRDARPTGGAATRPGAARHACAAAGAGPELCRFRASRRWDLVDHALRHHQLRRHLGDALAHHALRPWALRRRQGLRRAAAAVRWSGESAARSAACSAAWAAELPAACSAACADARVPDVPAAEPVAGDVAGGVARIVPCIAASRFVRVIPRIIPCIAAGAFARIVPCVAAQFGGARAGGSAKVGDSHAARTVAKAGERWAAWADADVAVGFAAAVSAAWPAPWRVAAAAGACPELQRFRAQRRRHLVGRAPGSDPHQRRVDHARDARPLPRRVCLRRRGYRTHARGGVRRPIGPGARRPPGP